MAVIKLTSKNFDIITSGDRTVLLDFYADWCGPCRMVSPIVDEISEEHPEYVVAKVNVDEEPELSAEFDVASIPTLVVIKNGKITAQSAGARPKAQILALLEG
ncbi:MAG: thioredoxin [Clostridia bacterium]|nr:thioredoxin [Clostridia bacterium]